MFGIENMTSYLIHKDEEGSTARASMRVCTLIDTRYQKLPIMFFKLTHRYALKPMKTVVFIISAVIALSCFAQVLQAEEFKKPLHFAFGKNSVIFSDGYVH